MNFKLFAGFGLVVALATAGCTVENFLGPGGPPGGDDSGNQVATLEIRPEVLTTTAGEGFQFQTTARNTAGFELDDAEIQWSIGNSAIADLEPNGQGSTNEMGTTTVTARAGSVSAAATLFVFERSTVDRPDHLSGSQVHVVYAVPAGGENDRSLDRQHGLQRTIGSMQNWLSSRMGGLTLRVDRYNDLVDVTFFELARAEAEYAAFGAAARDSIEAELDRAGFNEFDKVYAVYYDGANPGSCSGSAWPTAEPGRVAVLYLRGAQPGGAPSCGAFSFAVSTTAPPGFLEFTMLRAIVRTLGFVSAAAPNHAGSGFVDDSPNDLMYSGPEAWTPSILDFGQDDYFGSEVPVGVAELSSNAFFGPAGS